MDYKWGRDKRGRLYWYQAGTGKRVKAPPDAQRPRTYRKDKRGRGYWTWGDTGRRAPKPAWDEAPRYDRAGRPLDSSGRRIPRAALQAEPVLGPPEPPAPRRKKGPPVRPKVPARVRHQIRRIDESIPGFHHPKQGAYFTRPTESAPRDLERIFHSWLKGAVAKSPMASASEIGFRQFGLVYRVRAPLDMTALAELTNSLAGQPVRMVYRVIGHNEWEIWMHMNRPNRRTKEVRQMGDRAVSKTFKAATKAANIIYEFLSAEWDADFSWYEYYETEDDVYEG